MGAAVAAAAGAAARRARREIIDDLRLHRALDPGSAVLAPAPATRVGERQLAHLEQAGVVRRLSDGRVYLDEAAYIAWRDGGPGRLRAVVLIGLLLILLGIGIGYYAVPPSAASP